jgi:hypothetical protein
MLHTSGLDKKKMAPIIGLYACDEKYSGQHFFIPRTLTLDKIGHLSMHIEPQALDLLNISIIFFPIHEQYSQGLALRHLEFLP